MENTPKALNGHTFEEEEDRKLTRRVAIK